MTHPLKKHIQGLSVYPLRRGKWAYHSLDELAESLERTGFTVTGRIPGGTVEGFIRFETYADIFQYAIELIKEDLEVLYIDYSAYYERLEKTDVSC